ncbi:MAG: hypothetical protein KZQ95_18760 [Candidatus Thiodiazotropha sp. (ex Epidulcina cf. delphinae)]|nr:hypothetical protein [Candidatus Thiodiazotropha sp. (ex Epidulcina cf. delphinae)]
MSFWDEMKKAAEDVPGVGTVVSSARMLFDDETIQEAVYHKIVRVIRAGGVALTLLTSGAITWTPTQNNSKFEWVSS